MVSLKGISPLVATVLLIAITMTVAGGLAFFASSLVNTNLSVATNSTLGQFCEFYRLQVIFCTFNSTTSQLKTILYNPTTTSVQNVTATLFYPDGTVVNYNLNDSIAPANYKTFSLSNIVSGYTKVRFGSLICPDFSVDQQGCN